MKKITYIIIGLAGLGIILAATVVTAEKPGAKNLNRAILKINTLTCSGCFSTINSGLSSMEGYSGMGANLFRKLIAVDFSTPLTGRQISEKLSEIGYPGKLESVNAISQKESFVYLESKRTRSQTAGAGCCSSGGYPGNSGSSQDRSSAITPPSGSCCALPSSSEPIENL